MLVFAQVAVDGKNSQGNVMIMQKKHVSVAVKVRKSPSHRLLNLPWGSCRVPSPFSWVSAVGHFFSGEKILGGFLA